MSMSNHESGKKLSRREFLSLTNKAGIALVSAGSILSVIQPRRVFSASESGKAGGSKGIRPVQNRAVVTSPSREKDIIVSCTLAADDLKYLLNSEGSFIWNLCNGRHTLDMMAEALSLKYQKTPSAVENHIHHFVDTLKSLQLVEFVN
jgi:hypothetical protein